MKNLIVILIFLFSNNSWANIQFINFYSIAGTEKHVQEIDYLFKNIDLFDVWTPNWNSKIPKAEVIKELRNIYTIFSELSNQSNNIESFLALGDISHFLYNLDESEFMEIAVKNYLTAQKINPSDYRSYWFLGNHYAMAAKQVESINQYLIAKDKLPIGFKLSEFWENYAYAFNLAGMTSNCIYAMDQAKAILGMPCNLERALGVTIYARLMKSPIDSSFKNSDIWSSFESDKSYTCISRPWGLKVTFDKSWGSSFGNYENRTSVLLLKPNGIKGYNNLDVTYTIALINRVPKKNESLNNWVNQMISTFPSKNKIEFSRKYNGIIAYELKTPSMYTTQGGGHMYIIGIEREPSNYPRLNIEMPIPFKNNQNNNDPTYYRLNSSFTRFNDNTQYLIMLDVCESIHKEAFKIFKDFFENNLIIE